MSEFHSQPAEGRFTGCLPLAAIGFGLAVVLALLIQATGGNRPSEYYGETEDRFGITREYSPDDTEVSDTELPDIFTNCDEVRAYGADPIYEGDPGFGYHLDRDGDGVGCEPWVD